MASEIKVTNIKANDGTASLTVANSTGAVTTGQNLAVGGTLTSTGAITASGGIANAGTITAGTFNGTVGSTATFPAGHVIQVQTSDYENKYNVGAWVTSTSYSWSTYSCAVTMTNCTAGNKIVLVGTDAGFVGEFDKAVNWTWFVKDGANNEVNIADLATSSGGMDGETRLCNFYCNSTAQDWGQAQGVNGWYTVQASSGSSIEFRICPHVDNASNVWNSYNSTGFAMEVQA